MPTNINEQDVKHFGECDEDQEQQEGCLCVECQQRATLKCTECDDNYCSVCYLQLHRKGTRRHHHWTPLDTNQTPETEVAAPTDNTQNEAETSAPELPTISFSETDDDGLPYPEPFSPVTRPRPAAPTAKPKQSSRSFFGWGWSSWYDYDRKEIEREKDDLRETFQKERKKEMKEGKIVENKEMERRAKEIPLRLTMEEHKLLRLLEGTLSVCHYVDSVDSPLFAEGTETATNAKLQMRRKTLQLKNITTFLTSLLVSVDYRRGRELAADGDVARHSTFFRHILEVGRRHKVMNPNSLKTQYYQLECILQDSERLGFHLISPIETVYSFLKEKNALSLLSDKCIYTATEEIIPEPSWSRAEVDAEIKKKENAVRYLSMKYASAELSEDDVERCLYSISDHNSFLRFSRDPVDAMLHTLEEGTRKGISYAITAGASGSRLTHDSVRQCAYCTQSLSLWRDILHNMSPPTPPLRHTGQGVQRVHGGRATGRAMSALLAHHTRTGWIGSAVVHLGDHNVPNSLLFIDKYVQVPQILTPLVTAITLTKKMMSEEKAFALYVRETFGTLEKALDMLTTDFFKHAFDGSGADNFYDAGSCIDGRLTSAWHWCNKIDEKPYKTLLLLTGFVGFNGDWK